MQRDVSYQPSSFVSATPTAITVGTCSVRCHPVLSTRCHRSDSDRASDGRPRLSHGRLLSSTEMASALCSFPRVRLMSQNLTDSEPRLNWSRPDLVISSVSVSVSVSVTMAPHERASTVTSHITRYQPRAPNTIHGYTVTVVRTTTRVPVHSAALTFIK
jgi:hypothetical protein